MLFQRLLDRKLRNEDESLPFNQLRRNAFHLEIFSNVFIKKYIIA